MIIRPCAEFSSDLPDDIIEGDEDFVETGGRSVTWAIGEMLTDIGCKVDPPEYGGDHGWWLSLSWRKQRFWFQISLIHRYALTTRHSSFVSKYFRKNKLVYAELLTLLGNALKADPRFHNVEWYFQKDLVMGRRGEREPVSD